MTAASIDTTVPRSRMTRLKSISAQMKTNLFSSRFDTLVTIAICGGLLWVLLHFARWGVRDAVGFAGSAQQCRQAQGACWAAVGNNVDLLLFGTYPAADRWRATAALLVMITSFVCLFFRGLRRSKIALPLYCLSAFLASTLLLGGGWLGLSHIDADIIGGLTLTFFISWIALPLALPLALLLALARQSDFPAIRVAAISYIELVRGLPLIVVLFMSAVLFPLFLKGDVSLAKVFRAMLGLSLFAAAYFAEIIRGGLQAISQEQTKAAKALGLRYWQTQFLIVLPQVLPIIARPMSGMYITFFKNTSLVSVIGLFEITGITTIIITKPDWAPFSGETYLVIGLVYILCCLAISSLASGLERQFSAFKKQPR